MVERGEAISRVRAVLQAGGRGQRLAPYTDTVPKPLVPVAGVPMAERLARQLVACGINEITIITGWLGEEIRGHMEGLADLPPSVRFRFLAEAEPLGNFGAMAEIANDEGTLVFAFADLVTDLDFSMLLSRHRKNGASVTLASHVESYRVSLGEIVTDGTRVTAYREKPLKEYVICSGIAAVEAAALRALEKGQPCGISDFVNRAIAGGHRVEHWMHGATVMDVNGPEVLAAADARFG